MYMQICICVCIYIYVQMCGCIYIRYIFMCMYMYAYVVYVLFSIFPSFSLSFLNFFSKMLIIFFHKGNFILICLFLSSFYFYYFCYMLVFLSCLFQFVILMLFYINMFCLKSSAPHELVLKYMYTQNCKNYNTVSIICIF